MSHMSTISLDVTTEEVEALKVGAKFKATVEGKIVELEAEREFEAEVVGGSKKKGKKTVFPPTVRVELSKVSVTQPNKFSALVDDDDGDE